MKNNKTRALLIAFVIQLLAMSFPIAHQFWIKQTGELFLFKTEAYDPRDLFRGQYVRLNVGALNHGYDLEKRYKNFPIKLYAELRADADGFAEIARFSEQKPTNTPFLELNYPHDYWINDKRIILNVRRINRFYVNEDKASDLEREIRNNGAILRIYIKNGAIAIDGLSVP